MLKHKVTQEVIPTATGNWDVDRGAWMIDGGVMFPDPNQDYEFIYDPVVLPTKITRLAFRNRFTGAEKVALYTAAEANIQLKIYLDDLAAATFIDIGRADTIASVNALVSAGLLTSDRAAAILTDPVQSDEVPVL